jgi:hypothetical protein
MSVVPNIETLSLIAGVGGWSGVYHGLAIYLDDTPLTPVKFAKIALLPLLWGSAGITGMMSLWLIFQGTFYIVSNMLRPGPFILHMLVLCGIFCAYAARKQIRALLFVTPAEQAVAEQAQDLADATQADATQADADEADQDDDSTVPEDADEEVDAEGEEPEHLIPDAVSDQSSSLVAEVDLLIANNIPVTPRPQSPEATDEADVPAVTTPLGAPASREPPAE